jgi:transposase-like protein
MSTEASTLERRAITYRDYPEELKASIIAAIEANGGQIRPTARLFNLPYDTVHYWWTHSERFRQIQSPSATNLAAKLENIAHQYTDSLAEHDMALVTARDKAAIVSNTIDKMQLLRGEPTSITLNVERNDLTILLQSAIEAEVE